MINRASAQKEIQRLNKRVEELEEALEDISTRSSDVNGKCSASVTSNDICLFMMQLVNIGIIAKQALKLTNKEQT